MRYRSPSWCVPLPGSLFCSLVASLALLALWPSSRVAAADEIPDQIRDGTPAVLPSASQRFAAETDEVPDMRRHVLPLFGRLGCNGRACHGSFQGQGGFRLSLFGYDLEADHQALAGGDEPRVDREHPRLSLILQKPTREIDHEGGQRLTADSWQYRLLLRWIAGGANATSLTTATGAAPGKPAEFGRLEVLPPELSFNQPGESRPLRVVAHWSDGSREDVTALSRFRTNDDSVATVDEEGRVTAVRPGDTHIVAFYDNGVVPVSVITPLNAQAGENYPSIDTPTEIDRLLAGKLRQLGLVPSALSSDSEFLRRASLDVTGTLPTPDEVQTFLADTSSDKRERKVDELLTRPTYAAWWTTRLCDFTGNNSDQLKEAPFDGPRSGVQWYTWLYQRVAENRPYDEIVAGIVLASSRSAGMDYDDYWRTMNRCFRDESGQQFAALDTLSHYWLRRNNRKPEQMAEGFAYAFLGVRLQCAQCHKHPFDQWSKRDYEQFTAFFRRVRFGVAADAKSRFEEIQAEYKREGKKVDFAKQGSQLIANDRPLPWREVFIAPPAKPKGKPRSAAPSPDVARLLEGEEVDLSAYADPRQPLVDWLRRDPERYFARALVNRVWAGYFSRGIVEPPDDLSRANPPANGPLLDYLTREFVAHRFDMRWLHRTIVTSRAYQTSWHPNETNPLDTRNFSRAIPRRLPAEVTYNAILQATARGDQLARLQLDPQLLATGSPLKTRLPKANYALSVFGRPQRAVTCDCERSSEPTLLQTLYLQNDSELHAVVDRQDGWLEQIVRERTALEKIDGTRRRYAERQQELVKAIADAEAVAAPTLGVAIAKDPDIPNTGQSSEAGTVPAASVVEIAAARDRAERKAKRCSELSAEVEKLRQQVIKLDADLPPGRATPRAFDELVREAYLRTVSRPPRDEEFERAMRHFADAPDERTGLRDLMWALLNTKEFILNH